MTCSAAGHDLGGVLEARSVPEHSMWLALQALLLALRLWSNLPADLLKEMSLLPAGTKPPPKGFFTTGQGTAVSAAAGMFSQEHLQQLLPVLRSSSSSHPRLHSVWLTLLALLVPGFTATKVRYQQAYMLHLLHVEYMHRTRSWDLSC